MSVEIYPTDNPGTLAVDCSDVVTVEDARYILERCLKAARAHPVHFLFDCSDLSTLAPGVFNVLAGFDDFLQHPNTIWLAFVTQNPLLQQSLRLFLGDDSLKFFEDRATADHFLRQMLD